MKVANDDTLDETAPDVIELKIAAPLQSKIIELETTNHRLRVENLSLRRRVDSLRAKKSFEDKVILAGVLLIFCGLVVSGLWKFIAMAI